MPDSFHFHFICVFLFEFSVFVFVLDFLKGLYSSICYLIKYNSNTFFFHKVISANLTIIMKFTIYIYFTK